MNPQHLCMGCMTDHGGASRCPQCGYREVPPAPGSGLYLPPRTLLNKRYLIGRILGEGGFGITYLAYDLTLALKLAIKEFLPHGFATRAADGIIVSAYTSEEQSEARQIFNHGLEQFLEEARILARFNDYPGIVAVRDFFAANGTGYLVMNYLDGMTFKQHITAQGGRLSFLPALQLLSPVMDTLRQVHAVGLAHRDISPDNIYLTRDQQVKLIDFGAARFAMAKDDRSLSIIVKRGFAPVEQYYTHGRQGSWTDVYALAGTLYYALTGKTPPEAPARVLDDPLQPPSALGVEMPGTTEAVLLKGLAVRIEQRYQTIEAFQQELAVAICGDRTQIATQPCASTPAHRERVASDLSLPTPAWPARAAPPKKDRWIPLLGMTALAVIVAGGGVIWYGEDEPQPATQPITQPVTVPVESASPPLPDPSVTVNRTIPASNPLMIQLPIPKPLMIQLDTPRGASPRYRIGEQLDLNIQISEDGYLYCYYRDESGKIARIYPNRYAPDSYLRAGQRIAIPGQNAGFSIEFTRGSQYPEVLCLASQHEPGAKLPATLQVTDLEPIRVVSLEAVIQIFQAFDEDLTYQRLRVRVLKK